MRKFRISLKSEILFLDIVQTGFFPFLNKQSFNIFLLIFIKSFYIKFIYFNLNLKFFSLRVIFLSLLAILWTIKVIVLLLKPFYKWIVIYLLFYFLIVMFLPYFPHVLEAWNQRNHPNMLFLFYEDLKKVFAYYRQYSK